MKMSLSEEKRFSQTVQVDSCYVGSQKTKSFKKYHNQSRSIATVHVYYTMVTNKQGNDMY